MVPDQKRGRPSAETFAFWDRYFANETPRRDPTPAEFLEHITLLRDAGQYQDVEAALLAYLKYRKGNPADIKSWMYETLAIITELNHGEPARVNACLKYAADLAEQSQDPTSLISVADLLFVRGDYARVGSLVDQAARKVPHRAEPLMMSVNLAQKTQDPDRMASAIETLLALGWPGFDDQIRFQARNQAELLAATLKAKGRESEAKSLLDRLAAAEPRDLVVKLAWQGLADLDLVVTEPGGATTCHETPRTISGGSLIEEAQGLLKKKGDQARESTELYTCPRAFNGDYRIHVRVLGNNEEDPASEATLTVTVHEGTSRESTVTRTVSLANPTALVVHFKGGRRRTVLPMIGSNPYDPLPPTDPVADTRRASNPRPTSPGTTPAPNPIGHR